MDARESMARRPGRFAAVAFAIVAAFVVLSVRLYDLQIARGSYYRELAEQNRLLQLPVGAERGVMYDRNGHVLVRNVPGFAVKILPADLPRGSEQTVVARLSKLIAVPEEEIAAAIEAQRQRSPYQPVRVTPAPVGREVALLIEERRADLPGVRIEADSIREYADGPLYSPIIGYVGPITNAELEERRELGYLPDDLLGRTGIERTYERFLRGSYGIREVERDAAQREIRVLAEVPPTPGGNLVLTIDDKLQRLVAAEIHQAIAERKMQAGVGIAMNPQNGEILALVSIPAYDNNAFVRGILPNEMKALNADPGRPLVNKAIGDIYPPGSTFKLVTGLAALNEGVATRQTVVNVSTNVINVDGWNYFDWRAHGPVDFVNGFAHSSDIYFYTLGGGNPYTGQRGVGAAKIARYARMLGFGSPTGIDIPGEAAGIVPDPEWKRNELGEEWTVGNTYHMSIGQGFDAVTPLQLLLAYSAIANDGTVYRPHVLKEVVSAQGEIVHRVPTEVVRRLEVRPDHLRLLREAARRVVTIGHAYMPNAKLPIAGKTGTAEFGAGERVDSAGRRILAYHNWFVSFLPKQDTPDPTAEIAMVVFAYNTSEGCQREFCANPAIRITQRVLEAYRGVAGPSR
jgi:penicillin-binding protein 2